MSNAVGLPILKLLHTLDFFLTSNTNNVFQRTKRWQPPSARPLWIPRASSKTLKGSLLKAFVWYIANCHQLLSGFLAKGHLSRVSRQSRRSLTIRVIMKWSLGCAEISWHLPYSRGIPQKTWARRPSDEGSVRPVIASNGIPFLQMRSIGSHSLSGRN